MCFLTLMKLFVNFFDNILNRPSHKFFSNLFFLKYNAYFNVKNLNYIHIFLNLKKKFTVKLFKFNYSFYFNFLVYFIVANVAIQFFIILILL